MDVRESIFRAVLNASTARSTLNIRRTPGGGRRGLRRLRGGGLLPGEQTGRDFLIDVDQDVELVLLRAGENLKLPLENEIGEVDDVAPQIVGPIALGVADRRVVKQHPDLPIV